MEQPVIALITDFGEEDFFVGSLKGVIAAINPEAKIIDITHHIPSFSVFAGSFVLYAAFEYFPARTIFLSAVDPGVGSRRRILLVQTEDYFFVAPDNGILTLVLEKRKPLNIRHVWRRKYFLSPSSQTFEARDRMAPVAAWISKGTPLENFGSPVKDIERLTVLKPRKQGGRIRGIILYIDKFGNLITNIPSAMVMQLAAERSSRRMALDVHKTCITSYKTSYSAVPAGKLLFLTGSLGLIEIAVREGSAAELIGAEPGEDVIVKSV